MSNLQGAWAGRIYGTNTGNVFVELTQADNSLTGVARFHDDKFGIAVYEVSGSVAEGKISLKGIPRQAAQEVRLGEATIVVDLKQDGSLAGRWETTIGSAGTIKLFPHSHEDKNKKVNEPEQVYNRSIPVGSVRLFKKDITSLFQVIERDFSEGKLIVTYMQRGSEVTRFASDFLSHMDEVDEIRSLKIFIQERDDAPGINKTVNVDLLEKNGSAVRVSGIKESWVVGKAESISRQIRNYQNWIVTNYRKYGLNLNGLIFLIMLVLIPEISTWPKRLLFVGIIYSLLASLYGVHSKLIPNTVILAGGRLPGFFTRNWPSILSWVITFTGSLAAALVFWLLTRKPN